MFVFSSKTAWIQNFSLVFDLAAKKALANSHAMLRIRQVS
jgi:hypothetical protein